MTPRLLSPLVMDKTYAIRLSKGEDLKFALHEFVDRQQIHAGWIISCVGSLTECNLRYANQQNGTLLKGYFEIVSLSGTLSVNGCHLHAAVSDSNGTMIGGHVLDGCIINTTAEIIIGEATGITFSRAMDEKTGWKELKIQDSTIRRI